MALYVQRREGHAAPKAEYNFRATSLMSAPAEQHRYADAVRGGNPDSPQVVFGKGGFLRIRVESVSVLGPGLGEVRFAREEQKEWWHGARDAVDRNDRLRVEAGRTDEQRGPHYESARLSGLRLSRGRLSMIRSFAEQDPNPGPHDPRVRYVAYDPINVVRVQSADLRSAWRLSQNGRRSGAVCCCWTSCRPTRSTMGFPVATRPRLSHWAIRA